MYPLGLDSSLDAMSVVSACLAFSPHGHTEPSIDQEDSCLMNT